MGINYVRTNSKAVTWWNALKRRIFVLSCCRSSTTKIFAIPTTLNTKKSQKTWIWLPNTKNRSHSRYPITTGHYHAITNIESPDKWHEINSASLPLNEPNTQHVDLTVAARLQPILPDFAHQISIRHGHVTPVDSAIGLIRLCNSYDRWNQCLYHHPFRFSELSSVMRCNFAHVT